MKASYLHVLYTFHIITILFSQIVNSNVTCDDDPQCENAILQGIGCNHREYGCIMKNEICKRTCGTCNDPCYSKGCPYDCKVVNGQAECFCPKGYMMDHRLNTCNDINECRQNPNICGNSRNFECVNYEGSYRCQNKNQKCDETKQKIYFNKQFKSEPYPQCCDLSSEETCGVTKEYSVPKTFSTRIVGGTVPEESRPWLGFAKITASYPGEFPELQAQKCSVSILSETSLLTAAHCLSNLKIFSYSQNKMISGTLEMIELYFGLENRNTSEIFNQCGDMHYVPDYRAVSRLIDLRLNPETIKIHPEYDSDTMSNDIAVIKLNRPLKLASGVNQKSDKSSFLRPICLPNQEVPAVGQNCFVSGWGNLKDSVNLKQGDILEASILQEVTVPIQDVKKCKAKPKDLSYIHPDYHHLLKGNSWSDSFNNEKQLCAGIETGELDSCHGDSGGPLVCQRCSSCNFYVAGIVSYGISCGMKGLYGRYTKVSYYEKWINQMIDDSFDERRYDENMKLNSKSCLKQKWGEWSSWSQCSATCGKNGKMSRKRDCIRLDGDSASSCRELGGSSKQVKPCDRITPCAVFGEWSDWSGCSVTCGRGGLKTRSRSCEGATCGEEELVQKFACDIVKCAEMWGDWTEWSICSVTCDLEKGNQVRSRNCLGSSENCEGEKQELKVCENGDQNVRCQKKCADVLSVYLKNSVVTGEYVYEENLNGWKSKENGFFLYTLERNGKKLFVISPKNSGLENVMAYADIKDGKNCPEEEGIVFNIYNNGNFEAVENFEVDDCTCKDGWQISGKENEIFSKSSTQKYLYKGSEKLNIYTVENSGVFYWVVGLQIGSFSGVSAYSSSGKRCLKYVDDWNLKNGRGEFIKDESLKFSCVQSDDKVNVDEKWSEWSACSETCGRAGVRTRMQNGAVQNERCNVKKCESGKPETTTSTTTTTTTTTTTSTTTASKSEEIEDCSSYVDERQACQTDQWKSECFGKFKDWMKENCARTCCELKSERVCKDEYDQCKNYKSSCTVAKYSAFMTVKCPKTCGTCATALARKATMSRSGAIIGNNQEMKPWDEPQIPNDQYQSVNNQYLNYQNSWTSMGNPNNWNWQNNQVHNFGNRRWG